MEAFVPSVALTTATSSFVSDDWLNEYLPLWTPWFVHNHAPPNANFSIPVAMRGPASTVSFNSADQADLGFSNNGNGHGVLVDLAPATTPWNPIDPYESSRSHLPLAGEWPYSPLHLLPGCPENLTEADTAYRTIRSWGFDAATQQAPALIPGFSSSFGYHANAISKPAPLPQNSTRVSSSSRGSTEKGAKVVDGEMQSSITLYLPKEKKASCRRRRHRPCAINIDGLWIDKDELYSGASKGRGMINVYKCQWSTSTDPCGMWIVGTRFSVGAHIRKWHRQSRVESTVRCRWDGCRASRPMLRDSISRHIVTVHLGEGFQCRGCDHEFSRKDVYTRHVRKNELCLKAGAAMVYGAERKVIDTRQVLRPGGAIRLAD